jgi:hypothetical protein
MPKEYRDKFQFSTINPATIIACQIGKNFYEENRKTPPLKWCVVAAMFATQGQYEETHNLFPNWLRESFIKHKDWTVCALESCRNECEKMMFNKTDGSPKRSNHALVAALYAARDNHIQMTKGEPLTTEQILHTASKYGFDLLGSDGDADNLPNNLKNAAKKCEQWHQQFREFRESPEGQFWGEV